MAAMNGRLISAMTFAVAKHAPRTRRQFAGLTLAIGASLAEEPRSPVLDLQPERNDLQRDPIQGLDVERRMIRRTSCAVRGRRAAAADRVASV